VVAKSRSFGPYLRRALDDVVIVEGALDQAAIRRLRDGRSPCATGMR
jgi:hypothetical protein